MAKTSSYAGDTIWITGASSGIGRALALRLAESGAKVIASGRRKDALDSLVARHSNITPLVFDVTDAGAIESTTEQLRTQATHLNRIIINAGNCEYLDIDAPDWAMMERIMRVNFLGAVHTLAAGLPLLQGCPRRDGHIVAIASLATLAPFSRAEAYGASKAALQYFCDALRADLLSSGVDVTVVNPGFVKTPLTDRNDFPMPFLMSPERAAQLITKVLSRRPRQYDFPLRLKWLLKLLSWSPSFWYGVMIPMMTRDRGATKTR